MGALPLEQEIEYPTSDGQPMAETLEHQTVMIDLILGLRNRYAAAPDVLVGGNFFLCYERGNPRACVAPDVLLAKGVGKWDRPNYLLWKERAPSLIVEVTSRKTQRETSISRSRSTNGSVSRSTSSSIPWRNTSGLGSKGTSSDVGAINPSRQTGTLC